MSFPPPTPRQARVLWFALTALAVAVLVGLVGLFAWGVGRLLDRLSAVLMPVVLALILAYILDPVVEFFMRKKLPRIWAVLLVFVLGLLVLGGIIGSVVPGAIRESRNLIVDLPQNAETLRLKTQDFVKIPRWRVFIARRPGGRPRCSGSCRQKPTPPRPRQRIQRRQTCRN